MAKFTRVKERLRRIARTVSRTHAPRATGVQQLVLVKRQRVIPGCVVKSRPNRIQIIGPTQTLKTYPSANVFFSRFNSVRDGNFRVNYFLPSIHINTTKHRNSLTPPTPQAPGSVIYMDMVKMSGVKSGGVLRLHCCWAQTFMSFLHYQLKNCHMFWQIFTFSIQCLGAPVESRTKGFLFLKPYP